MEQYKALQAQLRQLEVLKAKESADLALEIEKTRAEVIEQKLQARALDYSRGNGQNVKAEQAKELSNLKDELALSK